MKKSSSAATALLILLFLISFSPLAVAQSYSIDSGIFTYVFFALIGGLILNLMPCVFPVLSLKALSFANNVGESKNKQRMDGVVFTLGAITAFVFLASILMVLRAGGELIGWGFQFQQPWFLAFMIYLFFTMGLSLSGVFEFGTGLMGVGNSLTDKKGYKGSFYTGVLATVVATPCTAQFMGPALGFALTQPWIVAMVVFVAMGLGMSLPVLILSFIPALWNYMPKPGSWMQTFKEFMAFPLYLSALFFLYALSAQVGVTGVSVVMGGCLLLALAAWLYQKRLVIGPAWRTANTVVVIICILSAVYILQTAFLEPILTS